MKPIRALDNTVEWVDARFPLLKMWNEHMARYYAPKNFNFWYYFGSLAVLVLAIQILTGIWLTMNYKPDAERAFASVEYIMRDVEWGWLIRYMHSTGASAFFIVIYCHMFRALLYGSYQRPRELLWITGVLILLVLMAEAFFGYLLPWGQMSYWGAQVIVSLFGAIPFVGPDIELWLRGDYVISDVTLNRFFSLHVIAMPLVLVGLVFVHIIALHEVGSNNPDGVEIKKNKNADGVPVDGIPFHPYYTVKDMFGYSVFLIFFSIVVFFLPEGFGRFLEANNFVPADPLTTPAHIEPVWYFTPFYSILRANTFNFFWVDAKLWGVIFMGLSVVIFAALPWLDRSPAKSMRYKSTVSRVALGIFIVSFLILGWLGMQPPDPTKTLIAQICTVIYFAYFIFMPWYSRGVGVKPVPARVTA